MILSRRGWKTNTTEALQSTRKVSNNLISCWDSERVYLRRRDTLPHLSTCLCRLFFEKVAQAAASALENVADITHEALFIGVELLELAPVPGLRRAVQVLLDIWDASQQVKVSFMPLNDRRHQFN